LSFAGEEQEAERIFDELSSRISEKSVRTEDILFLTEKVLSLVFPVLDTIIKKAVKIFDMRIKPVISAMEYLNTHYAKKVRCEDILREILLCSTDFYEYFRSFIHTTYSLYLQTVRVSRAHRAIAFTPYSLSYIANMCGFGDNTYMTKCYKKHKGYTPTEERMRMNISKPEYSHLRVSHDFFDLPEDTDRK